MGKSSKKAITDLPFLFAKDTLPRLRNNIAFKWKKSKWIWKKLEIRISEKEALTVGKEFTLFISNEGMDDIIEILESLGNLGLLIGHCETVNHEIKKQKGRFLSAKTALMTASGKRYKKIDHIDKMF